MKYIIIVAILFATKLNAQTNLNFDKRFVQSEDKWVAFKPDKDGSYPYGFIYIDSQAGLTLNYEGSFKVLLTGEFIPTKLDSTDMKIRLQPNNVLVAFIPDYKFKELKISPTPDWLKYYKTDTTSIERLYRWGYMYNGWNECAKALTYLEKAEKINPKFKGLAVELSFSYNCLKQYDKAELILKEEIKTHPSDAYVNKEYIYTLAKNNKIDKAKNQFETSLKTLKDNQFNAENCYNILQYYYYQKDKTNFNKWYKIFQKQPNENKMITKYADNMKADINK
ncbi:tetratricopeptide repeat protein [Flavobacterium sp.]|jgi:tetratricopeptide (TPR) repeat protein|uniref:tetratricopeptide repeat protein n=1 Tax=Flavobacterium sp. TaxID=239 RepID=UPI0037BE8F5B